MRGPRAEGPYGLWKGSGGDTRLPWPIVVLSSDDLEPRVAIALLGNPKLGRRDGRRQVQKLGAAAEIQKHADLPHLWLLDHLKAELAVGRVAAHDRDEDDPLRREVPLVQREGCRGCPSMIGSRRFLLHQAANTVGPFSGCQLFGEARGRFWAAVGVTNERA